jgi:RimJ/RimL family protein N-acetyltransferase
MNHDIVQAAFGLRLRPVCLEDAGFILELRCNSRLNRFIGETPNDIEHQKKWIQEYFRREGDYYFCIELQKEGAPIGTIGIYNTAAAKNIFEWGRWIISPGYPAAPTSVYLIFKTAFEQLRLNQVYNRTPIGHEQVVAFNEKIGLERCEVLKNDVELHGLPTDQIRFRADRDRWLNIIKPKLEKIADQASRFL